MSGDCNYRSVSDEKCKEEAIANSFISCLISNTILQWLLEEKAFNLATAFNQTSVQDHERQLLVQQQLLLLII